MIIKGNNKYKQGFSVIEALVAIAIFSFSIIGMIVILGSGINNTNYSKNKSTALYLAQEGIETIRNIRDSFSIKSSTGWANFISDPAVNSCLSSVNKKGCDIDLNQISSVNLFLSSSVLRTCPANCSNLRYSSLSGLYSYDINGVDSGFSRIIWIDDPSPNNNNGKELKITSTVSWVQGDSIKSVSFSENIFDWIEP